MPPVSPQFRFLLRGSLLLAAMLTLWWLILLGPSLFLLRIAAEIAKIARAGEIEVTVGAILHLMILGHCRPR